MTRSLLVRGLAAGVPAGVLAFAFALAFGEPQIDRAIAFEERAAALAGAPDEAGPVSRETQRTAGLLLGSVVMGVALASTFALVFAWAYGRVGALGARATAALLALGAFTAVTLVPAAKYPATPPAVGSPDTIDRRTLLFVAMVVIALLALVAAVRLWRQLTPRLGGWNAGIAAAATFLVVVGGAQLALPAVNEIPPGFPADALWHYRIASIGMNAVLWAGIGLGFGALAERLLEPRPAARRAAAAEA